MKPLCFKSPKKNQTIYHHEGSPAVRDRLREPLNFQQYNNITSK